MRLSGSIMPGAGPRSRGIDFEPSRGWAGGQRRRYRRRRSRCSHCCRRGHRRDRRRPRRRGSRFLGLLGRIRDKSDRLTDRKLGIDRRKRCGQVAVMKGFDLHDGLVGFDLGYGITSLDGVAGLLQPPGEAAVVHGVRQRRHGDGPLRDGLLIPQRLAWRPCKGCARPGRCRGRAGSMRPQPHHYTRSEDRDQQRD